MVLMEDIQKNLGIEAITKPYQTACNNREIQFFPTIYLVLSNMKETSSRTGSDS